jgi:metal-sulfur cluster biosynthetic enzyme
MSLLTDDNKKELQIYDALKAVMDPEVGINIIDLGLVYKIKFTAAEGILIEMTFSTRACPMGNIILQNVEETARELFPSTPTVVKLVWDPIWTPDFITPAGKIALNRR